jgi:hypothetical protein
MDIMGTAQGTQILLDEPLPFPAGTRVRVDVSLIGSPRRGSPASLLRLAGTLTNDEADALLKTAQECRRIDPALWGGGQ